MALDYLDDLGVDVENRVLLLVASHFHDDHIRGISTLARAAKNANVVVSGALRTKDFFKFVAAASGAIESIGSDEFAELLRILDERKPAGAQTIVAGPTWTIGDTRLYQRPAENGVLPVEVWAIAPPPAALGLLFQEITRVLPQKGETQRRAVALTPNRAAVVVSVKVGNAPVLLGADLEEGGGPTLGWRAVVHSFGRPQWLAHVFKVAHHGSENGHNADVWTRMLHTEPYAVLTPFNAGRKFLPSAGDVERIRNLTKRGYCTAVPGGWTPRRRDNAVERTLKEIAPTRTALTSGTVGHVRLRADGSQEVPTWTVERFNGAISFEEQDESDS